MSREKQIEEMAKDLYKEFGTMVLAEADSIAISSYLYNAGYRKQSEGVWIKDEKSRFEHRYYCSACNFYLFGAPTNYCEECGAKMKGGA